MSIHPLFDTRIANHLSTLVEGGCRVTYINWSRTQPLPTQPGLDQVTLIHRDEDPAFGFNVVRYQAMGRWIKRQAQLANADVVHFHDLFLLPLAPRVGTRVVYDIHEAYERFDGRVKWFAKLSRLWWENSVDGYVCTCEANRPKTTKPTAIVPNCQRRASFPTVQQREQTGDVHITYIGSLSTEDRRPQLMIDAARRVLESGAPARFTFGGRATGDVLRQLDAMAARYGERFQWHGQMPRDAVIAATCTADIGMTFIRPDSHLVGGSWHKIYEYLTVGAAVIASDSFDIAKAVRDAKAGELLPSNADATQLTDAILSLVNDRPRLAQMQTASAELGKRYSWENVGSRYLDLYRQIGVMV